MHATRMSSALLLCWMGVMVGCSSNAPEEKTTASSAASLVEVWEGTGAMAEARKYHAGVVLQSGKVLVVGGYNASGFLASATVYTPGTGTWTAAAAMPEARQEYAATLLPSGKVLVLGGENASGFLATASVYDPATDTWASGGTFASGVARDSLTATLLPSGKVLVAGGGNAVGSHFKVDVYDPVAGTWSMAAEMGAARRSHTATLLASGKVLVVGGRGSTSLATAEVYDPASNTWTATGGLATARYEHTATLLASGKVLVVGGRNSSGVVGTAEEYDPGTGTWSVTANALGSARALHTATLMGTGKVLVAGGQNGSALSSVEVYDPATRQWSAAAALGGARYVHAAVALESLGKVLVVGGVGGTGASQKTAELYGYAACTAVSCNSPPGPCYAAAGTCSNGVCSYAPKAAGTTCDDGNACTGGDTCNGAGVCAGGASSCSSPPGQCYEAAGTCSNGSCSYAYKASGASCNDGDACTVGEVCNGAGGCVGTPVSCNSPPGQCYVATGTCGNGTCTYAPKAAGTACDDGNGSTTNDVCNGAGVCAGAGACLIGGVHYAAGATNPSAPCQVCNPSVSTSSWSSATNGTSCGSPTHGSWGSCGSYSNTCDETGTQSRSVTAYICTSGTCGASTSTETQACTRNTGGTTCGTSTSCGACEFNDYCTTVGSQWCTESYTACASGTCSASGGSASYSTTCYRPDPSQYCSTPYPSYGAWSSCYFNSNCETTGFQYRTVTTYSSSMNCGTGWCDTSVASTYTETQACTRPPPQLQCPGVSYGAWSACSNTDTCGFGGTQTRTVTSYSPDSSSCQCVPGTYTETQACTLPTDYPYTMCNGVCVDLSTNHYNCGSCGHACGQPGKFYCNDGFCDLAW